MNSILKIFLPSVTLLTVMASAQPHYTVTDLKPLLGGNFSQAFSVNNTGVSGGQSNLTDATQRAVVWAKGSTSPILIGAGGVNSAIFGVNENGQAEVQSELAESDPNNSNFCGYGTDRKCVPFRWQGGALTALPLLGGNNGAVGGINSRGEISGWAETATLDPACAAPQKLDFEAVVWGPGVGEMRRLRPLSGDTVSMSIWINDAGQAVGTSGSCADTGLLPIGHGAHPVLWDKNGTPLNIGALDPTHEFGGIALSINNKGQVVGAANQQDGSFRPFLWSAAGGARILQLLPGAVGGGASAINDNGDAIGQSFDADGFPSPVLWRNGGAPQNLNDLAPGSSLYLIWPTTINARGDVSGFGITAEGDVHGFVATLTSAPLSRAGYSVIEETRSASIPENVRTMVKSRFGVNPR